VGIDTGEASVVKDTVVTGRPVRSAVRLSELVLAGTTLVSERVQQAAVGAYTLTRMLNTVLEGQRTELYLLGMAWSDDGILAETRLKRVLRASTLPLEESSNEVVSADAPSSLSLSDPPTSVARGASVFDGLLAADAQPVTYRYHWAFGWLFEDQELESEYRAQECRGSARYMPAAAAVALCVVVLAWLLSSDLGSMSAVSWATWFGALVTSASMCATARPFALGQRRLVLLHVMLRLCIVLLGLSVKYNHDLLNPMALYFVHYAMPVANVCLLWLPSCLPMLTIWFFEVLWIAPFSPRETVAKHVADTGKFELLVVLSSCVGGFAIALVLRARNRTLFADRTAALRSAERWAAARVQLQKEFQRVVPAPVARRIVAAGTAAGAARWQSTVSTSSTFDYDFATETAAVLAVELHRSDSCDVDGSAVAALDAALQQACWDGALTLCRSAATFLIVSFDDTEPLCERVEALTRVAQAVTRLPELGECVVLTGIGRGTAEGTLCGMNARCYEVTGGAVVESVANLDEERSVEHVANNSFPQQSN
jgi:hypothetical protein